MKISSFLFGVVIDNSHSDLFSLGIGTFLWLFHTFIPWMNVILFFTYCWFVTSWCRYLIHHLYTQIEFRDMFSDLLVSVFFYDFGLIVVRISL